MSEQQTLRILIVEDNVADAEILQDAIEGLCPRVELKIAKDGEEALDLLQSNKFDVIFMDLNMPRMTGAELLKNLYETSNVLKTSTIVITTTDSESVKTIFADHGFRVGIYMVKPMKLEDYNDSIRWVIQALQTCKNPPTAVLRLTYERQ